MKSSIIEINGVKFEVDLSTAKVVTEYKIGDKVNVLVKEYNEQKVYPAVIVGFDNFYTLPTITIAYLKIEYNDAKIIFISFNSEQKEIEIAPCRVSELSFSKADVVAKMEREIIKAEEHMADLNRKLNFFKLNFAKHFDSDVVAA